MAAVDGVGSSVSPVPLSRGEMQTQALSSQRAAAAPADPSPGGDAAFRRVDGESENGSQSRETSAVEESVRETNQSMFLKNRSIRFRVNQNYGDLQIQIVDSSRDKVIRSIPSDEMMRLASRMRELSGVGAMVDESR